MIGGETTTSGIFKSTIIEIRRTPRRGLSSRKSIEDCALIHELVHINDTAEIYTDVGQANAGSCKEMQEILGKSLKGDPFSGMRGDLVMVGRLRSVKVPSEGARERGISLTFGLTQIETTIPMPPQNPIPID